MFPFFSSNENEGKCLRSSENCYHFLRYISILSLKRVSLVKNLNRLLHIEATEISVARNSLSTLWQQSSCLGVCEIDSYYFVFIHHIIYLQFNLVFIPAFLKMLTLSLRMVLDAAWLSVISDIYKVIFDFYPCRGHCLFLKHSWEFSQWGNLPLTFVLSLHSESDDDALK